MIDPKRLAYIYSVFPRNGGAFEIREMVALRKRGIHIYIFSLKAPEKIYTRYAKDFLPYTYHSPFLFSKKLIFSNIRHTFCDPIGYFSALLNIIKANWPKPITLLKSIAIFPKSVYFAAIIKRLEIVHIHANFMSIPTTSAMLISRLTGIPFSCTGHGSDIYEYPPPDMKRRLNLASPFITISEYNKRYLVRLTDGLIKGAVNVVHCGVDLNQFKFDALTMRESNTVKILCVAALREIKGIQYLIKACQMLRDKRYNLNCEILGEGSQRRFLKDLITQYGLESMVFLKGRILPEKIFPFFQHAHIFVLPSLREGIPISAMEAMAMEIPVVCTNVYGIPELVENGKEGILVPPADEQALADAIETLIENPDLRRVMGENGRRKVEKDFNIELIADQLYGIYFDPQNVKKY